MQVGDNVNEQYDSAWKDLKRRWWLCLFLFLGYLPLGGGIGLALGSLFHSDIPFIVVGGAWFLAVPISHIYLLTFRCPRCKRPFVFRFGASFQNPFKPRCVHCGLAHGALREFGRVEENIAEINIQTRRRLKRSSLVGFSICLLVLIAIAVATVVGQKLIARPQMVAEQFLQQVQAHQYQQAHKLLTPQSQLKVQTLQQEWQAFEKAHPKTTKSKYLGAGGWPAQSVTLYYEIPDNKGRSGGAKIALVQDAGSWQVDAVTFYRNKTDMFPARSTPYSRP